MTVIWSRQARTRLQAIRRHIARDNPTAASRLIEHILHEGEALADHPHRGRMVMEVGDPSLRELIIRGYRVLYEVTESTVEIVTVFEGHRLFRDDEVDG